MNYKHKVFYAIYYVGHFYVVTLSTMFFSSRNLLLPVIVLYLLLYLPKAIIVDQPITPLSKQWVTAERKLDAVSGVLKQACPKSGPWAKCGSRSKFYRPASSCHNINNMRTPALSKKYDVLIVIDLIVL